MVKVIIKHFLEGMRKFSNNLIIIINSLLLLIVYFIGVGIVAILSKISGKKFLQTKPDKDKISYWQNLNLKKRPIQEYYRQF